MASLGILGTRGIGEDPFALYTRKLQEFKEAKPEGQAAPKSAINWWCWDAPGFKDCHGLAFQAAQHQCASTGRKDDPACLVQTADQLALSQCPCPSEPPAKKPLDTKQLGLIVAGVALVVLLFMPEKAKEKAK